MRVHAVENGYWTTLTLLVQCLVQIPVCAVMCVLGTSLFEASIRVLWCVMGNLLIIGMCICLFQYILLEETCIGCAH